MSRHSPKSELNTGTVQSLSLTQDALILICVLRKEVVFGAAPSVHTQAGRAHGLGTSGPSGALGNPQKHSGLWGFALPPKL